MSIWGVVAALGGAVVGCLCMALVVTGKIAELESEIGRLRGGRR